MLRYRRHRRRGRRQVLHNIDGQDRIEATSKRDAILNIRYDNPASTNMSLRYSYRVGGNVCAMQGKLLLKTPQQIAKATTDFE